MKNLLFTIALLSSSCLNSFAQFNCCPEIQASAEISGCNVEICFGPTGQKGELCEGDITFLYSIFDSNDQQVAFASTGNSCFLWTNGIPGETYTLSGFVYFPWECNDDFDAIVSVSFTIPEECEPNCCPDVIASVTYDSCDAIICFGTLYPEEDFCELGFTSILGWIRNSNGDAVEIFQIDGPCYTFTGGTPGATYTIGGKIDYPYACDIGSDVTLSNFTIPEDCNVNCCPVLSANATFEGCIATVCFEPINPGEDFCELGITSIAGRIWTLDGELFDTYSTNTNCFTFSTGEPGETYLIAGRMDYPYDCDTGQDIVPTEITIPESCGACDAPHNFVCNIEEGIMSLNWEGPANAIEYRVEIDLYIEGVSCCEGNVNQEEEDYITTVPTIPDVSQLTNFNCFVMRVISICPNGEETSTDWFCFPISEYSCPVELSAKEEDVSETRSTKLIQEREILLYPNPTFSSIQLFGSDLKQGNTVSIYNSVGTLISKDKVLKDNSFYKEVNHLKPSTYLVIISDEEGKTLSKERFAKH